MWQDFISLPQTDHGWVRGSSPAAKRLTEIADHFTKLFDAALRDKGLKTLVGIEDEFTLKRSHGAYPLDSENDAQFVENMQGGFASEAERRLNAIGRSYSFDQERQPSHENRHISRSTSLELKKETAPNQFEAVWAPAKPEIAVKRLVALRTLMKRVIEKEPTLKRRERLWNVQDISFSPTITNENPKEADITQGMHVNLSFWQDTPSGKSYNLLTKKPFQDYVKMAFQKLSENDALIVLPVTASYERIGGQAPNTPHALADVMNFNQDDVTSNYQNTYRMEYRLPDASADPSLAVMFSLAASYLAVKTVEPALIRRHKSVVIDKEKALAAEVWKDLRTSRLALPENIHKAMERFANPSRDKARLLPLMEEVAKTEEDRAMVAEFKQLALQEAQRHAQPPAFSFSR